MLAVPEAEGVNNTWQVAEAAEPATRVQLAESKEPAKEVENVTVPTGDVGLLVLVSVTVAVQVEAWFTTTGVPQTRVVEVGCIWDGAVTPMLRVTERERDPIVPFTTTW